MDREATREPGWWWGPLLIVASVVIAVLVVIVASGKSPNTLAAGVLQGITIITGTLGSFIFGKVSARQSAAELVKPHARSAFRRVRALYGALGRQRTAISEHLVRLDGVRDASEPRFVEFEHVRASLLALDAMVVEQVATADDALEDWRDLVPEEVADIERQARKVDDHGERS